MSKHSLCVLISVTLLAACLSACVVPGTIPGDALVGSGKYATRDYTLEAFTGIEASGGFNVTVTGGDAYKVSVTADDNLLDVISVKTGRSRILRIGFDSTKYHTFGTNKLNVVVTMPELESVQMNGGCKLQHSGPAPKATSLTINANGGSNVDLRGVAADKVSVTLNGGSRATVNAKTSLDYDLNGGASLQYTGGATIRSSKVDGGASATRF